MKNTDLPQPPWVGNNSRPILAIFQLLICVMWLLSLVEWTKQIFLWAGKQDDAGLRNRRSLAIDIYELAKWTALIVAVIGTKDSLFWTCLIPYLLASNLFSHFYYHVWKESESRPFDHADMQRRLTSFILAFGFMLVGFAYVFLVPLQNEITWPDGAASIGNALFLSVANTFTLTYGGYGPESMLARTVFVGEIIYAFFFVVIIVATSLPERR